MNNKSHIKLDPEIFRGMKSKLWLCRFCKKEMPVTKRLYSFFCNKICADYEQHKYAGEPPEETIRRITEYRERKKREKINSPLFDATVMKGSSPHGVVY